MATVGQVTREELYKDAVLDALSERANVAQFVSFEPSLRQRYARVRGYEPNATFASPQAAVEALLQAAPDCSVNVRSFAPKDAKSRAFVYGLRTVPDAMATVRQLAAEGLFTVVNETIDVRDGGVSGVALGDLLEFAPDDTPRCVEKPGTASLPRAMGLRLLETVYAFPPALNYPANVRVEFSLHPLRRGFRHEHTIVWEMETMEAIPDAPDIRWPNLFSQLVGDKTFGLLVADALKLPVPRTTVIPRRLAPFQFAQPTGTNEIWLRTCPKEQVPGRFTTQLGWGDVFRLMADEDPDGTTLASVLAQEGVDAFYSGALLSTPEGDLTIEGVRGYGDSFMLGKVPEPLPLEVRQSVKKLYKVASKHLGPVRFEWVHDGRQAWIVQLHRGATLTSGRTIYPGEARSYRRFEVADGLEALRSLINEVKCTREGIILVGDVGVTSHLGDLLRRAHIPSRIEPPRSA